MKPFHLHLVLIPLFITVVALVLGQFTPLLSLYLSVDYSSETEFLVVTGQLVFQVIFILKISFVKIVEYLFQVMTVSLFGALLLIPLLIWSHFYKINDSALLVYFFSVVFVMFLDHSRRVKKLIIAGGNGFLGKVLCNYFAETNEVIILTRGRNRIENGIRYENWDAQNSGKWIAVLDNADVLINLVGRTVDCRYNEKNKKEILSSRIESTTVLGNAIQQCQHPPKLWINSASATIYRHSEDKEMSEDGGEIGFGFSVDVCNAWEKSFFDFKFPNTRQVAIRTSIVLGKTGGAVKPLINLARFGLGGKQGSGNQFFSWIHEDDFARAIEFIIQNKNLTGPVNVVSPKPVQNKELMKTIRKAVGIPFGLPMPEWVLGFGARIIKTETELILKSRNVVPEKLIENGFEYKYGDLESALSQIV